MGICEGWEELLERGISKIRELTDGADTHRGECVTGRTKARRDQACLFQGITGERNGISEREMRDPSTPVATSSSRSTQIKTYSWDNAQVLLVGNKCDMEDERVVSSERGRQLADHLGECPSGLYTYRLGKRH